MTTCATPNCRRAFRPRNGRADTLCPDCRAGRIPRRILRVLSRAFGARVREVRA